MHKNSDKTQAQLETGKIAPRATAILCASHCHTPLPAGLLHDWLAQAPAAVPKKRGRLSPEAVVPKVAVPYMPLAQVAVPTAFALSPLFRTSPGPYIPVADRDAPVPGELPSDFRVPVVDCRFKAAAGYQVVQRSGKWLDQDDLDVLLVLLDLARRSSTPAANKRISLGFSARSVLYRLGRWSEDNEGGSGLISLRQSLHRLWLAKVEITTPAGPVKLGLIDTIYDRRDSDGYGVDINIAAAKLFAGGCWTRVDLDVRLELSPLAKFFYTEFSGHRRPFPRTLEHFAPLCGRTDSRKRDFKKAAELALAEVTTATGWDCRIPGDKVICVKHGAPILAKQRVSIPPLTRKEQEEKRINMALRKVEEQLTPEQLKAVDDLYYSIPFSDGLAGHHQALRLEIARHVAGLPPRVVGLHALIKRTLAGSSSGA